MTEGTYNGEREDTQGLSGWIENPGEADDGYARPGPTFEGGGDDLDGFATITQEQTPQRPDLDEGGAAPERPEADQRRKSSPRLSLSNYRWVIGVVALAGAVFIGGRLYKEHQQASVPSLAPAQGSVTHKRSPGNAALPQPAKPGRPATQPTPAPGNQHSMPPQLLSRSTQELASADRGGAPNASPANDDHLQHTLNGLKHQLATIQTRLAKRQTTRTGQTSGMDKLDHKIAALTSSVGVIKKHLTSVDAKLSAHRHTHHRVLDGYRLLAVVGHQAVIEDLSNDKAAVLGPNGHIGGMTVYEVNGSQVVTNYGVF